MNGSVRSVADLLAAAGLLALKLQLLQRRRLRLFCPFWIRIGRGAMPKDATTWLQSSSFLEFLEMLAAIKARFACICGALGALIHADHGLMGEESISVNPEASAQG